MVRKRVLKRKRRQTFPRSRTEQDLILADLASARRQGMTSIRAFAESRGLSASTIHRWQRARIGVGAVQHSVAAQQLGVSTAIGRLANLESCDTLSALEALFKFAAWLRWPTQQACHPVAITMSIAAYLADGYGPLTLVELPKEQLDLLLRHVRLNTIFDIFSLNLEAIPDFDDNYPLDEFKYTPRDYIADIGNALVAEVFYSDNDRLLRIDRIKNCMVGNALGRKRALGESYFHKRWTKSGAASAFLYIERDHSILDFELDPRRTGFKSQVDEILGRQQELTRYFENCRWAVEGLKRKLRLQAVRALNLPGFPPTLAATPLTVAPL